jgi:hypothetical protein
MTDSKGDFSGRRPRRRRTRFSPPGRTKERLAALLRAEGFEVHAEDLCDVRGHWRTSKYAIVYRWECFGNAKRPGDFPLCPDMGVSLASWDTMTACVRRGIVVQQESKMSPPGLATAYEIHAKAPPPRAAGNGGAR